MKTDLLLGIAVIYLLGTGCGDSPDVAKAKALLKDAPKARAAIPVAETSAPQPKPPPSKTEAEMSPDERYFHQKAQEVWSFRLEPSDLPRNERQPGSAGTAKGASVDYSPMILTSTRLRRLPSNSP
jgi:hypothetical protein